MHVIPVEKAIENVNTSVSVEHISHWLNKYDKYSVGICTCRKQQALRNEGTGDIEGEYWCRCRRYGGILRRTWYGKIYLL